MSRSTHSIPHQNIMEADPRTDNNRTYAIAITLAAITLIMGVCTLLANFLANKLCTIWLLDLDGGILVFPIIYVCGDLLVELFGEKIANRIALFAAIVNALAFVFIRVVDYLPDTPGINNLSLNAILGSSARIIAASTFAYCMQQVVNNHVYEKMRKYTIPEQVEVRSFFSSLAAHVVDSGLFTFIAFWGYKSLGGLTKQAITSLIAALIVEAILIWLITGRVARALRSLIESC